jgi:hypothetical protein
MRIRTGVATIPLFRVDVPSSSEGIGLATEPSRPEPKDKVEGGKELGQPSLPASQELGRSKIFQIFVIRDHVNRGNRTLEVPTPYTEHFKDSKQFLVVGVVVQLGGQEWKAIGQMPPLGETIDRMAAMA